MRAGANRRSCLRFARAFHQTVLSAVPNALRPSYPPMTTMWPLSTTVPISTRDVARLMPAFQFLTLGSAAQVVPGPHNWPEMAP